MTMSSSRKAERDTERKIKDLHLPRTMPATEPQFTPTFILILRGSRLVSSSLEQLGSA